MSTLNLALMGWAILQPIAGIFLARSPPFQPGWVLDCISPTSSGAECVTEAKCGPLLEYMGFDLSTAFLTAPGGAVFWSTDASESNPNQNMISAQTWATSAGKKTLEQTQGGAQLEKLNLFSGDASSFPREVTSPINGKTVKIENKATSAFYWNCASLYFAKGVAGTTHAFAQQVRLKSPYGDNIPTFFGIELPTMLVKNPNQLIVFHYNDLVSVAFNGARYENCANLDALGTNAQTTLDAYKKEPNTANPQYGIGDNLNKADCPKLIQNFYPTPINNAQSIAYDIASKGLSWVVHNRRPPPSH